MMIISYVMKKTDAYGRSEVIELCGEFRDLNHFETFKKNEEFRGWFVRSFKIEKEK